MTLQTGHANPWRGAFARLSLAAGLVAGVLAMAGGTPATADDRDTSQAPARVGVSNLAIYMADGPNAVTIVPAGTEAVEVRFDYIEATGHEISLLLKGRGGIDLFSAVREFTGDGSARIAIDGAAVFPRLAGIVDGAARDAKRNAKQAATQSVGTQEFLLSVQAGILRTGYALTTLDAIDALPPDIAAKVAAAEEQTGRALRRAERAIALPADDVAGKQREADAIDALLGPVVQAAGELTASAGSLSGLALPGTGSGPQDAYVVQVHVDGDVAATSELWVFSPPQIFLPYTVQK